ncbi:Beta-fructofuranosidase 1 [Acorus gramineus]|uniref:Beta-fructofuranosidase 1 n=1 Tax=Acorus gramineus TaxID=55184 RepID=A0AAV9ACQ1_ACOGR|nr:Beta-fructofuranosidase 1 [Acorus gramineus]
MSDYYAIGTYDADANTWTPDDPVADAGIGARVDYGKYYASKSFFDQNKGRRVLWAWIGETDSERTDLRKGWASVQVVFDCKISSLLLVSCFCSPEITFTTSADDSEGGDIRREDKDQFASMAGGGSGGLENGCQGFQSCKGQSGSVVPLDVGTATQLDIEAEFVIEAAALEGSVEADVGYNCSTSAGAAGRSALGPFGLLILANEDLSEQTAVYFYIGRAIDGSLKTYLCQDELRSSKVNDLGKRVYGSMVPVLHGEKLSVRILKCPMKVDHSVVESFGQGGRTCITSRVYPTKAIYGAARVFLFNNATEAVVTATSVRVWGMNAASIPTMLR